MRHMMIFGLGVWVALMLTAAAAQGEPGPSGSARAAVEKIVHDALAVLRNPKLSAEEKRIQFRDVAYQNMDFQILSRLALGRHWRELSDGQRTELVEQIKQHIAKNYSHITDNYTDEDVTITGDRQETDGDWTVQTKVVSTNKDGAPQDVAKVVYRLRQHDGGWKVIDISVEDVSMVINCRDEFQGIIADGGIDHLLDMLRKQNAIADK